MSKTTFRSRTIEPDKPISIFHYEDLKDLNDYTAVNRSITQMPTGMEKEEELEHHLRVAMEAQSLYGMTGALSIPIPEVIKVNRCYPKTLRRFVPPKYYIKHSIDFQEISQKYDADSEDDIWVETFRAAQEKECEKNVINFKNLEKIEFEKCIDKLEFIFKYQPQELRISRPDILLNLPIDIAPQIYKYWQSKRHLLKQNYSLVPEVRTEQNEGVSSHDPYVAFRKRFEKMQTRKNRKYDEALFEKLVRTHAMLIRISKIIKMTKERENLKLNFQILIGKMFALRINLNDSKNILLNDSLKRFYSFFSIDTFSSQNYMVGYGLIQYNYHLLWNSNWRVRKDYNHVLETSCSLHNYITCCRNKDNNKNLSLFYKYSNNRVKKLPDKNETFELFTDDSGYLYQNHRTRWGQIAKVHTSSNQIHNISINMEPLNEYLSQIKFPSDEPDSNILENTEVIPLKEIINENLKIEKRTLPDPIFDSLPYSQFPMKDQEYVNGLTDFNYNPSLTIVQPNPLNPTTDLQDLFS